MASENYLLAVPDEILLQILAFTETFPGFRACSCTCKRLAKLCNHPSLQHKKKRTLLLLHKNQQRIYKRKALLDHRYMSSEIRTLTVLCRSTRSIPALCNHCWFVVNGQCCNIKSTEVTLGVAHATIQQNNEFLGSKFGGFSGHVSLKKGTKLGILLDMDCDPVEKKVYYFQDDILISYNVCPIIDKLVNATDKEEEKRKLYPAISMWYHGNHVSASFELPPPLKFSKT